MLISVIEYLNKQRSKEMSHCTCCNRTLLRGEWKKVTPDGKENTLCNICIDASFDTETKFKDPACYMATEMLIQHSFSTYCPD